VPIKYDARDEDSIKAVIANSNVIVNCIGNEFFSSCLVNECSSNTFARKYLLTNQLIQIDGDLVSDLSSLGVFSFCNWYIHRQGIRVTEFQL
jgi:hypothetical protein